MHFFFYLKNNTLISTYTDANTQYQILPYNHTFFTQPFAINLETPRVDCFYNCNEIATNLTDSPSELSLVNEKPSKKREKNFQRELISAKKNGQSNIINSYFSYILSRIHSEVFVKRIVRSLKKSQIDSQKIISIFYVIMKLVNLKRARRYINKVILLDFFTVERLEEMFGNLKIMSTFTYEEVSSLLRKCFIYYLREISLTSILTSKRIPLHSKRIHLKKLRRMLSFVCQQEDIKG